MSARDLKKEEQVDKPKIDEMKPDEKKPEPQEEKMLLEQEPNEKDDKDLQAENEEIRKKRNKPPPKANRPTSLGTNVGMDLFPGAAKKKTKKPKLPVAPKPAQQVQKDQDKKKLVPKTTEKSKTTTGTKNACDKDAEKKKKKPVESTTEVEQAPAVVPRSATGSESLAGESDQQPGFLETMWAKLRRTFGCC